MRHPNEIGYAFGGLIEKLFDGVLFFGGWRGGIYKNLCFNRELQLFIDYLNVILT